MITLNTSLLRFLRDRLAIPETSIASALQQSEQDSSLFPIILWQYKLITLEQLDQIFDWLAITYANRDADPEGDGGSPTVIKKMSNSGTTHS